MHKPLSKAAKLALVLPLLVGLAMSGMALFAPDRLTDTIGGIQGTSPLGEASVRADFAAFFLTYTIGVAAALFAGRRDWLWAPIALFGLTMIGRLGYGVMNGFPPGAFVPIGIEFVMCALMLFAWRSRPAA